MKKFFKTSGWVLLFMAIYFIAQAFIGLITGIVFAFSRGFMAAAQSQTLDQVKLAEDIAGFVAQFTPVILIIAVAMSFPLYLLIGKLRKRPLLKTSGFNKISAINTGILVAAGISTSLVIGFGLGLLKEVSFLKNAFTSHEKLTGSLLGGNNFIIIIFTVGILVPIFEEILFRSLVFNEIRRNTSLVVAVIIQGLLFGLYHLNVIQGIYASLVGILFGLAYVWLRSIWAPILLHVFMNSTSVMLSKLPDRDISDGMGAAILVISVVVLVACVYYLWKKRFIGNDSVDIAVEENREQTLGI